MRQNRYAASQARCVVRRRGPSSHRIAHRYGVASTCRSSKSSLRNRHRLPRMTQSTVQNTSYCCFDRVSYCNVYINLRAPRLSLRLSTSVFRLRFRLWALVDRADAWKPEGNTIANTISQSTSRGSRKIRQKPPMRRRSTFQNQAITAGMFASIDLSWQVSPAFALRLGLMFHPNLLSTTAVTTCHFEMVTLYRV